MKEYWYRARIDVWLDDWGCTLQCSTTRFDAIGDVLGIEVRPVDSQTTPQDAFADALSAVLSGVEPSRTANEGGGQV